MSDLAEGWVKVLFPLKVETDWPPVGAESMWAQATSQPGVFKLQNIPFFARDVAWGDTVRAAPNAEGLLEVEEVVGDGGHYTIRVILMEDITVSELFTETTRLGAAAEVSAYPNLIAIDVPDQSKYPAVSQLLLDWRDAGRIGVEESKMPSDLS